MSLVLNVNDSAATRYLVSRMLEKAGVRVIEAASGAEALKKVREEKPRLVVLDIKLPDIDGLEVCHRIKTDPQTQSVKVLHTSAVFVAIEYKVRSLERGADGYLSHPFEQEELIATVRSLLRLTEAEQALRDYAQELQAANRRTNEFLAMLAHELRNPLAAIVTSLPLLERRSTPDPVEKTAREVLRRQTTHLRRLVDDLLDVARVTQGKIDLHWEALDLTQLVQRVASNLGQSRIEPRGQHLRLSIPATPIVVRGDPMRLEQILTNLLDNASKYSDGGGEIEVVVTNTSGQARILVRDQGIGISSDALPTIFDLFSQADVPLARSRGGLGIGLTLVRTLVGLHGGSVEARSAGSGAGSEFEIVLPTLASPAHEVSGNGADHPHAVSNSRKRVLLIEDNADAQEALRCLLESWGHSVMVADDGASGVDAALRMPPEVAIVDLGLPKMDGYEVARRVRASLGARTPLLIALTGYGAPDQRAQALAAGFDLHLVKPVEPERLEILLDEFATRAGAARPMHATTESSTIAR